MCPQDFPLRGSDSSEQHSQNLCSNRPSEVSFCNAQRGRNLSSSRLMFSLRLCSSAPVRIIRLPKPQAGFDPGSQHRAVDFRRVAGEMARPATPKPAPRPLGPGITASVGAI